jgi:hypothetical protein
MQWFCRHDPATGLPREEPYSTDFTQPHGAAVAARVLEWLADNMPGLEYQRKAPRLVRQWQAAFPRCTAAQMNLRLRIHLQNLTEKLWCPYAADTESHGRCSQRNAACIPGAAAAPQCS